MNMLISLLTHRSILVRGATGTFIGTVIFFGVWVASLAWLPEGLFLKLPLPSIASCEAGASQVIPMFAWNLVVTGSLVAFSSMVSVKSFPYGYVIPWLMYAIYGGLLGTNSFLCEGLLAPLPVAISVLWTRAGFREATGYLLIAAALANQYLWRQPSFFSCRVERVRLLKDVKLDLHVAWGLLAAILLIGWGAAVEAMP